MKKLYLVMSILVAVFLIYSAITNANKVSLEKISGEILMRSPNLDGIYKSNKTEVTFSPSTKHFRGLDISCSDPSFSYDKKKIIGTQGYEIIDYDLPKLSYRTIFKGDKEISYPKYVPNSNLISFIYGGNLVTFNLYNKGMTAIANNLVSYVYSWSKDGRYVYFDGKEGIFCFDVITQSKKEFIRNASHPILSMNNNYFAYRIFGGKLIVKELSTGAEWTYTNDSVVHFNFSPDANYIAIIQAGAELPYLFNGQKMVVWDYKNNTRSTLITNVGDATDTYFDWK